MWDVIVLILCHCLSIYFDFVEILVVNSVVFFAFKALKVGSCCFKWIVILLVYFPNCQYAFLQGNK